MSPEDPRAEFDRYIEEHKGEPVDPAVVAEAKQELLLDELNDAAEHDKQADRGAIIASMPAGKLSEVDLADWRIPQAIEALTAARKKLIEDLDAASDPELLADPRHTTFATLEKARDIKLDPVVSAIRTYMTVDPETTLYELPELMGEFLSRLGRRQDQLDKDADSKTRGNNLHEDYNYE